MLDYNKIWIKFREKNSIAVLGFTMNILTSIVVAVLSGLHGSLKGTR